MPASSAGHARASLLGLAVGDAMGAPVAGLKGGRVVQLFGALDGYVDAREPWTDRPWRWHLPGLHTDETQQALSLIAVHAQRGEAPPEAVSALWLRMKQALRGDDFPNGAHRGIGPAFRKALDAIAARESITGHHSAGSGAAARAAVLGVLHHGDPEALTRAVIETSLLTHTDPRAVAGALAVAQAIEMLLGGVRRPESILSELVERVSAGEEQMLISHMAILRLEVEDNTVDPLHAMSRALAALPGLIAERDDALAERTLLRQANQLAPAQPVSSITNGFAPATVPVALYHALAHDRFAAVVTRLAGEGKESDTAAAIAGAVLGARLGEESIPDEWIQGLVARHAIEQFADALAVGDAAPDLVEMETALTRRECEARRPLIAAFERDRTRDAQRDAAHPKRPKPTPAPTAPLPFAPPPHTYLSPPDDPEAKRREKAARGRKRIGWKEDRRRQQRDE